MRNIKRIVATFLAILVFAGSALATFDKPLVALLRPMAAKERLHSVAATGEREQDPLIYNSWMRNLSVRRPGLDDSLGVAKFLARDHQLKKEVFSAIDCMSEEDIIKNADGCFKKSAYKHPYEYFYMGSFEYYLQRAPTLRELFIAPTAGGMDLTQAFVTGFVYYSTARAINEMLGTDDGYTEVKARLKYWYTIIKAMEIWSRRTDAALFQAQDLDWLVSYLKQFGDYTTVVSNLLAYAGLLIPVDTPAKREGLKNLIALIERLMSEDENWRKNLLKGKCQMDISAMRQAQPQPTRREMALAAEGV